MQWKKLFTKYTLTTFNPKKKKLYELDLSNFKSETNSLQITHPWNPLTLQLTLFSKYYENRE